MNNYEDTLVQSLVSTTLISIGVWAVSFVVLRHFRGKIEDKYIKSIPLWLATDLWMIIFFFKEIW